MKIKSILIASTIAFILLFYPNLAQANTDIRIIVNFAYLNTDVNPMIESDYCLIPLRALSEEIGFNVEWDDKEQKINIYKESDRMSFQIGNTIVVKNGKSELLPIAPRIVNDRTMVPLRYISECFGKKVKYGEMNGDQNIWITDFDILNENDVEINDNYYMVTNDPVPYYRQRDNAATSRGIKIGDKLITVKDIYGIPRRVYNMANGNIRLTYISKYIPNTGLGSSLYFEFKDDVLISVELDPPN